MEAHTFTRLIAFFVDIIILSIFIAIITFWVPSNDSKAYKDAVENESKIMEKFKDGEITTQEFIKQYFENYYIKDKETVLISLITVVVSLGYFGTFAFYNNGQTFGKKLMKIKIVSNDGKEAPHLSLIIRALIINSILTSMLSCVLILFIEKNQYIYTIGLLQLIQTMVLIASLIMVAFRNDKRGIHDIISKTKVIQC
jgi:uncharacterized RDD family membrane protein YckC